MLDARSGNGLGMAFDLTIENGSTVTVTGDVDVHTAYDVYLAAVRQGTDRPGDVPLDLAGVTFIDSVGLSMLVRARDELARDHGSSLVLVHPSDVVVRLLSLTALRDEFRTQP